jgi:hypothetical protein
VADECNAGICLPDSGTCRAVPANQGEPCNNGDGVCNGGVCEPVCLPTGTACAGGDRCCAASEVCFNGRCQLTPVCNQPLRRAAASRGSGTAGLRQCPGAGVCDQTIQVDLTDARVNQNYDVYVDEGSRDTTASLVKVGTFRTNGAGNAFWTGAFTLPAACPAAADIRLVRSGGLVFAPDYEQNSFVPCTVCG